MVFRESSPLEKPLHGWLEMISGTMFSGKSEELIRRLKRVGYARKKYQLFKPSLDNRYSELEVVTHANEKMTCIAVQQPMDILMYLEEDTHVVGIDEIQFFQQMNQKRNAFEIEDVVKELLNKGIIVIGAGLDRYSTGEHFGPMPFLVNMAKFSDKYHAVCVGITDKGCGAKSYISFKIGEDTTANKNNNVTLGSFGEYIPLCENCWTKAR